MASGDSETVAGSRLRKSGMLRSSATGTLGEQGFQSEGTPSTRASRNRVTKHRTPSGLITSRHSGSVNTSTVFRAAQLFTSIRSHPPPLHPSGPSGMTAQWSCDAVSSGPATTRQGFRSSMWALLVPVDWALFELSVLGALSAHGLDPLSSKTPRLLRYSVRHLGRRQNFRSDRAPAGLSFSQTRHRLR